MTSTDVKSMIFLQGPLVTDNSNFIVDCLFDKVKLGLDIASCIHVAYVHTCQVRWLTSQ